MTTESKTFENERATAGVSSALPRTAVRPREGENESEREKEGEREIVRTRWVSEGERRRSRK